jgi:hypothetical protein
MTADKACTVVFLGPSCSPSEARQILADALYLPPASCGDILYALRLRPKRLAIIDGVFGDVPSIWHKEILFAMSKDVEVWGAASMGALRAAELDPLGMRGFGQVYRWFKDGTLTDDDEVALPYFVTDQGYEPIADPMVNIRATVQRAIDTQVVSAGHGERVIRDLKAIHYQGRRLEEHLRAADGIEDRALSGWLSSGHYTDIKRHDAVGLLQHLREAPLEGSGRPPLQWSLSLRRLLLRTATTPLPFSGIPLPDSERQLQSYASMPLYPSLRRLALLFAFFDGWCRSQGGAHAIDLLIQEYVEASRDRPQGECVDLLFSRIRSSIPSLQVLAEAGAHVRQNYYEACLRLDGAYSSFKAHCNLDTCKHERADPLYHRILVLVSGLWQLFEGFLQSSGLAPSATSIEKYAVEFRRERGLLSKHDMRGWLRENDLNIEKAGELFAACSNFNYLIEGCFFEQFGFFDVAYERNWLLYAAQVVAPEEITDVR